MMMKKLLLGLAVIGLCSCSDEANIVGSWVQPIPGMENQVQGIKFEKDGKLASINMATLAYSSWEKNGDTLVLSGESIGNGVTIPFSDTYRIEKLDNNVLILKDGDFTLSYTKMK